MTGGLFKKRVPSGEILPETGREGVLGRGFGETGKFLRAGSPRGLPVGSTSESYYLQMSNICWYLER